MDVIPSPSSKATADVFKVFISAVGSSLPALSQAARSLATFLSFIISTSIEWIISHAKILWIKLTTEPVTHTTVIVGFIGLAVFVSALLWLIRLANKPRQWAHKRSSWSPMYRKSSYSSRCLREAISSKAPFAETVRRETVIYKMGSAFSARQRRAVDMF